MLINGWRLRVPARWTMQLMAPALAAAYALGRVGCFLVGDDYGGPTTCPGRSPSREGSRPPPPATWPPSASSSPRDWIRRPLLAVHPTQLYETILMFLAFMVLWKLARKTGAPGAVFGVYLMMAGVERFLIEILRAKDDRFLAGFTMAQLTSVGAGAGGVSRLPAPPEGRTAPAGEYLSMTPSAAVK